MENEVTEFYSTNNYVNYGANEEISPDLQKKLKRINKLPNGLYETRFKIDRYKYDRASKSKLSI